MQTISETPPAPIENNVDQLYRHRFPPEVLARRDEVWKVLCHDWFGRYVPSNARVLEIAAGYCEFINNISAAERVAVDLNPETPRHAAPEVQVYETAAENVAEVLPREYFDVAFMSNFLEHCRTRDHLLAVLRAAREILKPDARLLILGPNFRYCYREYYDYFDHHLPLSEKAVVEALNLAGFVAEEVYPQTPALYLPQSSTERVVARATVSQNAFSVVLLRRTVLHRRT